MQMTFWWHDLDPWIRYQATLAPSRLDVEPEPVDVVTLPSSQLCCPSCGFWKTFAACKTCGVRHCRMCINPHGECRMCAGAYPHTSDTESDHDFPVTCMPCNDFLMCLRLVEL